jgi:hypothetical protein
VDGNPSDVGAVPLDMQVTIASQCPIRKQTPEAVVLHRLEVVFRDRFVLEAAIVQIGECLVS